MLILDATTGQNAHAQVETFQTMVNVTGLIVTKLDGTARGGVLVALAEKFGLPVHAIGVGETAADMRPFAPDDFARSLMGLVRDAEVAPIDDAQPTSADIPEEAEVEPEPALPDPAVPEAEAEPEQPEPDAGEPVAAEADEPAPEPTEQPADPPTDQPGADTPKRKAPAVRPASVGAPWPGSCSPPPSCWRWWPPPC